MAAKATDRLRVRADKALRDRTEGNDFAGSVLPPLGRAQESSLQWSDADSTLEYVLRHRLEEYQANIEAGELNSAASNLRESVVILLKIMDMAGLKKKEAVVEAKTSSPQISRKLIREFVAALDDALDEAGIDPVESLVAKFKIDGTFPPRVPQILAFEIKDRAGQILSEGEATDLAAARRNPYYPYRRRTVVTPSQPAPDAGEDLTPNSALTGDNSGEENE
jgi:hypothetical protein